MRSIFYLLDTAPYGSEKAYGALNAAAVSLNKMAVTVGLYGDGVYSALMGQDTGLNLPSMADILYAYPEMKFLAHEPSLAKRGLLEEELIETVELVDEESFLEAMEISDCVILL
jgi:tRNA 2-thiouridine synthesizing protein C